MNAIGMIMFMTTFVARSPSAVTVRDCGRGTDVRLLIRAGSRPEVCSRAATIASRRPLWRSVHQAVVDLAAHEQLVGAERLRSLRRPDGVRLHDDDGEPGVGAAALLGQRRLERRFRRLEIAAAGQRHDLEDRDRAERRVDRLLHGGVADRRGCGLAAEHGRRGGLDVASRLLAPLGEPLRRQIGREARRRRPRSGR